MILTLDSIKRKTGKVSVRNGIVDKSLMIFQPPYETRYGLHATVNRWRKKKENICLIPCTAEEAASVWNVDFSHLDASKACRHTLLHYVENNMKACLTPREPWHLIWQPWYIFPRQLIILSCHLKKKSTLRRRTHAGSCEPRARVSVTAQRCRAFADAFIHALVQMHSVTLNWIREKINMINCYLFCP